MWWRNDSTVTPHLLRGLANGWRSRNKCGMTLAWCLLISVLCLPAAGCGFKPLYSKSANDGAAKTLLAGISIDEVASTDRRMGQQLKAELEDRLNPGGAVPPHPAFRLKLGLTQSVSAIGVAPDGTISRYNIYLNSSFTLYRNSDGKQITSGAVSDVGSYNNVSNAYFSTYVSQEDAVKRGIIELAELYRGRLAAYLSQNGGNPPVQAAPATTVVPPLQNVIKPGINTY